MGNNQNNGKAGAMTPATKEGGVPSFIEYKNRLTSSVLNKISDLRKGGITVPPGYNAENELYMAFLVLTDMKDPRSKAPILTVATPQSVANAMLGMCIQGLSLWKKQCAFILYGNEVQCQRQYQGNVALAKRYGAGDPQAQVIYEGDDFEYEINPATGKIHIIKHEQHLANINKDKIVGAWCIIPYAEHPEWEPKVEVMTMAEIRQSWMQGATKGGSPAHMNFTQEMAKKTVINRACKLFFSTSDDIGIYDQAPEFQENRDTQAPNSQDPVFADIAELKAPKADEVNTQLDEQNAEVQAPPVQGTAQANDPSFDDSFFQA